MLITDIQAKAIRNKFDNLDREQSEQGTKLYRESRQTRI